MVAIADATVRQNLYETVYDLVAAEVASSTSSIYGWTLTSAFIDLSANPTFPQIVIHPAAVDKERIAFASSSWSKKIDQHIDIWTKKNKDVDIGADKLSDLFDAATWSGVNYVGHTESPALETANDNKLHLTTITLTFIR